MRVTANVNLGEIDVMLSADIQMTDYGIPMSPRFPEYSDHEIAYLNILGIDVNPKDIPDSLYDTILQEAIDTDPEYES